MTHKQGEQNQKSLSVQTIINFQKIKKKNNQLMSQKE